MAEIIPIALFAYARPNHLRRTLESLRSNQVSLIYAFSDGPKYADKQLAVEEVRDILRMIDWCKVILVEREDNWGTGRSILSGVTAVLEKHDSVIVFEDDLICIPGTGRYLSSALNHYRDAANVMSVTGWTHPRVVPSDVGNDPYFDGRAESWVWGTWRRAWRGMELDAKALVAQCISKGLNINHYGTDLPAMADVESQENIWAVRWIYHHILQNGLCMRPPHSMVEHIGFDSQATHASEASLWANPPLQPCPPLPEMWPTPVVNQQCARLWQEAARLRTGRRSRVAGRVKRMITQIVRLPEITS